MRPAPVRRIVAACGLIALVPIALQLFTGQLPPVEAAGRGVVVLVLVVVLTRLAGWGLAKVLLVLEKDQDARRGTDAALDEGGLP